MSLGSALIFESFLSAAYHFCPTGDNYQFGKSHITCSHIIPHIRHCNDVCVSYTWYISVKQVS